MSARCAVRYAALVAGAAWGTLLAWHPAASAGQAGRWRLSDACPPAFEAGADGTCTFRSLYELYGGRLGHGGLRAALPPMRAAYGARQIDLGRYLFFDPVLAADHRTSCAHCHHPDLGYADGRGRSLGLNGVGFGPERRGGARLLRGAPTLWNVGFLPRLFWDGRAASLEQQATGPLFAADEMGNSPQALTRDLNAIVAYRQMFGAAFARDEARPITVEEVVRALAAFETSLVSFDSRYDRYAHGDTRALTSEEIAGLNVFRGFVARCSQCHIPPLFTDGELAVIGAPAVGGEPYDLGAGALDSDPALRGAFRVPTLRNIARTAPYFQAGQLASLGEVVGFYNDTRGHVAPAGAALQIHWHIAMSRPMLSDVDAASLVAFLGALTDESLSPPTPGAVPSGLPVVARIPRATRR